MTVPPVKLAHQLLHLKQEAGYTLSETMVVMLIWSVMLSLSIPFHQSLLTKLETEQFLKQFQQDVLLAQRLTTTENRPYLLHLRPKQSVYLLYDPSTMKTVYRRSIPEDWAVDLLTLKSPIEFNFAGQIRNPGTFTITTPKSTYQIVFPFGKGRCVIHET
ncbi:competence type IV pilus minor pilin ComGD [Thalassobacillus sp. CUG 92003]|uniref:competence type IV pilus minor pilin ComGD n=1 Tax=Thalassobacillus sp. CUG 92003 TaxID=2736641 RepID=UPI0015E7AD95|nr:competence type IV pilus minor pilin ComGD [Thalassobacillus sp. CUG 92003]